MKKTTNNRIAWMDMLKIVAAYMIVVIHISGPIFNDNFVNANGAYYKGLILNSIVRFAVPCFFMISGALMLSKERTIKYCVKKAVSLFCAMVFWSVVYILYQKIVWHNSFDVIKEILTIPFQAKTGHMWYIYQLIWIYLTLPIIYKLYTAISDKYKIWFVSVVLFAPSVLDYICKMFTGMWIDVIPSFGITFSPSYIGLIILGRYLYEYIGRQSREGKRKIRWISVGVTIVAAIVLVLSTVVLSANRGASTHDLFGELRLPTVVFGIGVYCFANSISDFTDRIPGKLKNLFGTISDALLQVYLGHVLIQWILSSYLKCDTIKRIIVYSVIEFIICILSSCIYNFVKKKIKEIMFKKKENENGL